MSEPRSIDISHVTYLKSGGAQTQNVRFQEDDREWGFTNKGMMELPVHSINQLPAPNNGTSPKREMDVRLETVLKKGDWHRARNTDQRWTRASAFSVSKGQSKDAGLNYQPNPSAYDVMLRNRSTITEVNRRPETAIPSTPFEVKPRLSSNDLSGKTPRSPVRTDMPLAFRSDVTIPTAAVLSVSSAPISRSHSIHSIMYFEDSKSKRRRTRLRPKTASTANLQAVIEPPKHWTLRRLNSEYELKKAYATVTGEKLPTSKNSGLHDSCMTSFYTEESQRVVRVRALKSAPLASLLKRQKVPVSYMIAEDSSQLQLERNATTIKHSDAKKNMEEKIESERNDRKRQDLKTR